MRPWPTCITSDLLRCAKLAVTSVQLKTSNSLPSKLSRLCFISWVDFFQLEAFVSFQTGTGQTQARNKEEGLIKAAREQYRLVFGERRFCVKTISGQSSEQITMSGHRFYSSFISSVYVPSAYGFQLCIRALSLWLPALYTCLQLMALSSVYLRQLMALSV